MRKKLALLAAILLVVLGVSTLAFWLWFPAERVRSFIATEGTRRLGVEVRVGDIRPSIFPLGMRIAGLELANPAGADTPPFVRLGEGSLTLRFAPLFSRRLEIGRAKLDDVEVVLVMGPDGKILLPRPVSAPRSSPADPGAAVRKRAPFAFLLSSFDLENGSLRILDPAHSKESAVRGMRAHSGMEFIPGTTAVRILGEGTAETFTSTDLATAGLTDGLRDVHLAWDLAVHAADGMIKITQARAGTGDVAIQMSGDVTGIPRAPSVALLIPQQAFELSKLLPLLPPLRTPDGKTAEVTGSGTVGVEGEIRVVPDRPPEHEIKIAARGVSLKTSTAPVEITGATGLIRLAPQLAEIQNLSYNMVGQRVNLAGVIHMPPEAISTENFRIEVGRTALSLSARMEDPRGAKNVTFRARSRFIDLLELMPRQPAPAESGGKSAAPGTAAIGSRPLIPPIPVTAATGTLEVDTLVTTGVRIVGARSEIALRKDGLSADLAADAADTYGVPLRALRGRLAVTPEGSVTLEDATARVYSGTVAGDIRVRITGPGQAEYDIAARAEELEANDFLSDLTPMKNMLFGRMAMSMEFHGNGLTREALLASIDADGTAGVTGGRLTNVPVLRQIASYLDLPELAEMNFRTLESPFEVRDGRVQTRDVKVAGGEVACSAAGSVGFDGKLDYDLSLTLSKALSDKYRRKTRLAELFVTPDERMVFDFKVGGPAKDPKVSYDAKKTASRTGVKGLPEVLETLDKDGKGRELLEDLKKKLKKP